VADQIVSSVIATIGAIAIAYAILGRLLKFHRPISWQTGGSLTFVGELCFGTFLLCLGLAWRGSGIWIVVALAAWIVVFISQRRAQRRYLAAEQQLRNKNAAQHPGIFDQPPPTNVDDFTHEHFNLYDAGACVYLGQISKADLKALISRLNEIPEQGPNDLYLEEEFLALFAKGALGDDIVQLIERAFKERDYLLLRWLPSTDRVGS
jgi:hypothetical protein